jgi:hypothetical protein
MKKTYDQVVRDLAVFETAEHGVQEECLDLKSKKGNIN